MLSPFGSQVLYFLSSGLQDATSPHPSHRSLIAYATFRQIASFHSPFVINYSSQVNHAIELLCGTMFASWSTFAVVVVVLLLVIGKFKFHYLFTEQRLPKQDFIDLLVHRRISGNQISNWIKERKYFWEAIYQRYVKVKWNIRYYNFGSIVPNNTEIRFALVRVPHLQWGQYSPHWEFCRMHWQIR